MEPCVHKSLPLSSVPEPDESSIVYVLFIVYVTLPPSISPIAVGINNNNNEGQIGFG
jgi:hypothetical protein